MHESVTELLELISSPAFPLGESKINFWNRGRWFPMSDGRGLVAGRWGTLLLPHHRQKGRTDTVYQQKAKLEWIPQKLVRITLSLRLAKQHRSAHSLSWHDFTELCRQCPRGDSTFSFSHAFCHGSPSKSIPGEYFPLPFLLNFSLLKSYKKHVGLRTEGADAVWTNFPVSKNPLNFGKEIFNNDVLVI